MGKMILASASPRRAEILKNSNYNLEIVPSPYEEIHSTTVFSFDYVENLAYNKAKAVIPLMKEDCIIIGADTVVVLNNKILEKPKTPENAKQMLHLLSDKTHKVVTAIAVIDTKTEKSIVKSVISEVTFNVLTDGMIDFYVDNFKPLDKAGAYGIQELPAGFVKNYTGSLENIIGICPVALQKMLNELLNGESSVNG
ncbi:septum formation protein Maf [bacterium]|nr:septum formation protein Maf [bacterium]